MSDTNAWIVIIFISYDPVYFCESFWFVLRSLSNTCFCRFKPRYGWVIGAVLAVASTLTVFYRLRYEFELFLNGRTRSRGFTSSSRVYGQMSIGLQPLCARVKSEILHKFNSSSTIFRLYVRFIFLSQFRACRYLVFECRTRLVALRCNVRTFFNIC